MKSPLRKLKNLALHKSQAKDVWERDMSQLHGLPQAAQDMMDMRAWHDRLLFAAAATANTAYEFSQSLLEMGNCLLEKTTINDNGESGRALFMLGRVQLELQKLVDTYRSDIIQTITNPSESLLSELRKVEEMKLQCDEKREMFEDMMGQHREKRRSRHGSGENFSSQQLQAVLEEYNEAARLCVFRVESLKQGQSRSLLTQAARHHAAQLIFFRRGLRSLEAVEPHIKHAAGKQHIEYELYGLDDVEDSYDEMNSFQTNDNGEISFDYRQAKEEVEDSSTPRRSTEINFGRNQVEQIHHRQPRKDSHSAPIYSEKFDPAGRFREVQTTVQKLNTYVLPTPPGAMSPTSKTSNSGLLSTAKSICGSTKNPWHSSPLDTNKHRKFTEHNSSANDISKAQIAVKENNSSPFVPLPPPPLAEAAAVLQRDNHSGFDIQEIKRQAFSGPLGSKPSYNKFLLSTSGPNGLTELPQSVSGLLSSVPLPQPASFISMSYSASTPLASSPRTSELPELLKPPDFLGSKPVHSSAVLRHSAPLDNRNQELSPTNRSSRFSSKMGSPLPLPPVAVPRSFSIPTSQQRAIAVHGGKFLDSSQTGKKMGEVVSPPLTPIFLSNIKSPDSRHTRGKLNSTMIAVGPCT